MYKIINIDPFVNETDELSVKLLDIGNFEKNVALLGHHIPEEIIAFSKINRIKKAFP